MNLRIFQEKKEMNYKKYENSNLEEKKNMIEIEEKKNITEIEEKKYYIIYKFMKKLIIFF